MSVSWSVTDRHDTCGEWIWTIFLHFIPICFSSCTESFFLKLSCFTSVTAVLYIMLQDWHNFLAHVCFLNWLTAISMTLMQAPNRELSTHCDVQHNLVTWQLIKGEIITGIREKLVRDQDSRLHAKFSSLASIYCKRERFKGTEQLA